MTLLRRPRLLLMAACTALTVVAGAAQPAVQPADVLEHIRFLASDEMRGRGGGSEELERAAEYIAARFSDAGLAPGGDNGTWFQPFELEAGLAVGEGNSLTVQGSGRTVTLDLASSYYPMAAALAENSTGAPVELSEVPLVFGGYGITAPGLRYDDYGSVDVRGKAVIVFSHEPQEQVRTSRFNGNQPIPETSLFAKATAARNRGAVALLIVSDPAHTVDQANYAGFLAAPEAESLGIPVLRVARAALQPLINAWDLDALARGIDEDLRPRSRALPGATVSYRESLARNRRVVRNVVGILRGQGPLAAEAIVIGAHYDHVGLGGRYSAAFDRTGEVHNGADDNASGTAAIIEMARSAAAADSTLPRTLVFVAFAGEELGLLGSKYYTEHPVVPLSSTVAMLNLDMVGRLRGSVEISGLEQAPSLTEDVNLAAAASGIRYRQEGPGEGRSDDFPFLEAGLPAIGFFTGFHSDYHRPSDDWTRINADGTARIAQMAIELAARIAARPVRPVFTRRPQ